MESLVNYGSDDEIDTSSPSKETGGAYGPARSNSNEDNYEAVVMDMSEDSNSSSRSSPKQIPEEAPSDDRRKERDRESGSRHKDRSRSRSGSRNEQDRSRSGRDRDRDRHRRDHDKRDRRDRDRDRDYDRDRDSERDRDRDRDRGRDRDDRHGSRRDEKRRKSRSRSRSGSRSPSGSPRNSDRHRRDRKRNPRKEESSSSSKSRGDSDSRGGGSRQGANRPNSRPGGFYSKINNKINVLERLGIALKPDSSVNPQMLAQRAVEQQAAQVKLASGVEISSYLNPAAQQRFAEQMQKKRLLWGARPKEEASVPKADPMASKWQGTTFAHDNDGKVAAKFNRLMGIKGAPEQVETKSDGKNGNEIIKKQEEMFHNMESQYEVARLATHTHRGLGLGFGTFQPR